MINKTPPDIRRRVAEILVERNVVDFRTDPFFRFTSGADSPIYLDNRRLLGYVGERREIVSALRAIVAASAPFDTVVGMATAGVPWAAWLADALSVPLMYVRSEAKKWGQERSVEGAPPVGTRALLVEDLVFSASSIVTAANNVRNHGLAVHHCVAIVSYGTESSARNLESADIELSVLTTVDDVLSAAVSAGTLSSSAGDIVRDWLAKTRQGTSPAIS